MPTQNPVSAKVWASLPWLSAIAVVAGVSWLSPTWAGEPYAARLAVAFGSVLVLFVGLGAVFWWKKKTREFIPLMMVILALLSASGDRSRSSPSPPNTSYPGGISLGHTIAEDDSLGEPTGTREIRRTGNRTFTYIVRKSPTGRLRIGSFYVSQGGQQDSSFMVFFSRTDLEPLAPGEILLLLEQLGGGWEEVIPGDWRKDVLSGSEESQVWLASLDEGERQLTCFEERGFMEYVAAGVPFGD